MKTIVSANAAEHSADKENVTELMSSSSSLKSQKGLYKKLLSALSSVY